MKTKYMLYVIAISALMASCKNADDFQDMVYFTVTENSVTSRYAIDGPASIGLTVTSSTKMESDLNVKLKAAPELLDEYNRVNERQYKALPKGSYDLSAETTTILKGQNVSNPVRLSINSTDKFEDGVTYCMPVTITGTDGNMPVLESFRTLYIVIDRTIITYAASLDGNYFKVPFSANEDLKSVPNVSMETRVFVNKFQASDPFISSVIGIEENFLLRFGDVNIHKEQLQLAGGGYPLTSTVDFQIGRWYHVAIVYDGSKLKLYIDGKLNASTDAPRGNINLADTYSGGFQIGYSANGRLLNGAISETRVWTKALTEAEIQNNLCYVDPTSPNLLAYWRFNEGEGDKIKDWTGHGYDLKSARKAVVWIKGVRCPN